MLNQLTAQAARLPELDSLEAVIREILGSPRRRSAGGREPGVWLHDDGNRRSIRSPRVPEPTIVEIISTNPRRDSDLRTFTVVPLSGSSPGML